MTLDTTTRYTVAGHGGIAFYAIGYAVEWTEESWEFIGEDDDDRNEPSNYVYNGPEQVENPSMVRMVMVGDDYVWTVDVDDLTPISEDDYCHECGQIGCTADGRERA